MTAIIDGSADAERQLAIAHDRASGAEGVWIDEDSWREQATYERDTNAWVDDPYDRVPASEVLEDARALHDCAHALGMEVSNAPHPDVDETMAAAQACLDALDLARRVAESQGSPRGPDGRLLQVPEIAERLHDAWVALEEAWQVRADSPSE